jgi:hypothetical protein
MIPESNPIPLLLIRAHILTALKNGAKYSMTDLVNLVHQRIVEYDVSMTNSVEEARLYKVILDMVESGSLLLVEGIVSRNLDHVKNIEEAKYKPDTINYMTHLEEKVSYDGSNLVLTANSEDYTENYLQLALSDNDFLEVELVAEPANKFDSNAVCIVKDGLVLGYLDRSAAKEYQPHIIRENSNARRVVAGAIVKSSPYIAGIYYLDLRLR